MFASRAIGVVIILGLAAGACTAAPKRRPARAPTPAPIEIVLVRHAETAGDGDEPGLSEAGQARAACLATTLEGLHPTHLFTSPRRRTRETLAPLAAATRLIPVERDPMDAEAFARELEALPAGSVAVVVGHTNTIPALAKALGAGISGLVEEAGQMALPRSEHARMFVLHVRAGEGAPAERFIDLSERSYGCGTER